MKFLKLILMLLEIIEKLIVIIKRLCHNKWLIFDEK